MNSSLNHVYRIVWNAALGLWQVASEATRGRGKTGSSQQARKARRALAAASALALVSPAAWAVLPTGGVVVAGQASIQQAGNALNIVQGSDKAAIDWQSFSIGQGNTVNFQQLSSSSVALNRVLGNDVSVIQGAINANGQVFLVNQNGVLFTPTAQVNVGGIVASTQTISTDDFMAGRYKFSGNSTATVENQGSIKAADGGVVALIAAKIINSGSIEALKGTVGLAAGNTVLLDLGGPVKIQVTEGALNAAIEQSGGIRADGGMVYLTAKAAGNLAASVINHTGVTKALSMASLTGEAGEVAQATGSIALSADLVNQAGTLDVSGLINNGRGGQVDVLAGQYTDSGTTLADGSQQGGSINVRAKNITQTSSAVVSASSSEGEGGRVELIGDLGHGIGEFGGKIYATGRRRGGFVDTSGAKLILNDSLRVDTSSSEGETGTWLLDPIDFTIAASGGDLTGAALSSALLTSNVTIQTLASSVSCSVAVTCGTGNTSGNGDINVNDSVSWSGATTLTLKAHRNININENITSSNAAGKLALEVGQGGTAASYTGTSGNTPGDYYIVRGRSINLQAGANFLLKRGSDGTTKTFTVLRYDPAVGQTNNLISANDFAGNFALGSDVLLNSGVYIFGQANGSSTTNYNGYNGEFHGLGHSVKGFNVTQAISVVSGLSGVLSAAPFLSYQVFGTVIRDVTIDKPVINISAPTGSSMLVAGLLGPSRLAGVGGSASAAGSRTTVSGVYVVDADFSLTKLPNGTPTVAGIVAGNAFSTVVPGSLVVQDSLVTGKFVIESNNTVTNFGPVFGGIVSSHAFMQRVGFDGTVTISSAPSGTGALRVGGLAGSQGSGRNVVAINNSYARGTFNLLGNYSVSSSVGGLHGSLTGGFAATTVLTGADQGPIVVGINNSVVDNTWNISGLIVNSGGTLNTGLFGNNSNSISPTATFNNLYYNSDKVPSGWSTASVGGSAPAPTGVSTALFNMQSNFSALDFNNTWAMGPNGPLLRVHQVKPFAPSIQQVFIRLACGTLCFNTYGDTLPSFVGDDFAAANGTTPLTNATLTGNATFSVWDANNNTVSNFSSLSNAGTYKFVYTGGLTASGFELVAGDAVTWTVTPRTLTVELTGTQANPLTKVYDGNANLALSTKNFLLGNFAPGTSQSGTISQTNGVFNSPNVATANLVTASLTAGNLSVTGDTLASNYVLPTSVSKAGTITPKALTVALQAATNNPLTKVYDGKDTLALTSGNFAVTGFVGQQGVGATLGGVSSATFNSKNVLQATTVSADLTTGTLSATGEGFQMSNYSLPTGPVTATGSITAKGIAVSGLTAQNKTYDGNRNAVITGTAVVDTTGVIQGDTVTVSGTVTGGLFADKDAGTDKAVSVSGLSLSGSDAGNYAIAPANLKATITPKALSVENTTVANKDYDGNTSATVTVGTLKGVVDGETLGTTTATGQFAGKDVVRNAQGAATAQNVTVAYALANGTNAAHKASNYTLASETKTATINPKALTVTGTTVADKTYNGTLGAIVTVGELSGFVGSERLGTTTAVGTFADKDVARDANGNVIAKNVTVAYTLAEGASTTMGGITGIGVPMTGGNCATNPAACVSATTTITAPIMTPGAKVSNYTLASETKTAKITPKALTISGSKVTDKQYDSTTTATVTAGTLTGFVTVDGVTEALGTTTAVGTFASQNASPQAQNVTAVYTLVNGLNAAHKASNYSLANEVLTGKITQRVLSITGSTVNTKTYDGKKAATVTVGTLGNVVMGETLGTTTASGEFADPNAGSNKDVAVTYTLASLDATGGALASNYTLAGETLKGTINQKAVTVAGIAANGKTYDGNATAMLSNQGSVATGIDGETLTVSTTGAFNDKNAGARKVNTTTTLSNGAGGLASNYMLSNATNAVDATIAQKAVTVAGIAANGKTYDGNTTATLSNQGSVATGIDGETLTVSTTGTFNDKNAGARKVNTTTVLGNGTGGLASNYSLSNATNAVDATIAQKAVTVAGIAANGKTYDGNTTATLSNQGSVATGISSEALTVMTTGTFNDKNAGARKVNTTSALGNGTGGLASNYTLSNATNAVDATIAQKAVTVAGIAANGKTYDGNTSATLSNQGTVATGIAGETLAVSTTGSFDKKDAGARKVNTTTTIANNGSTLASNYTLSNATNAVTATIAQKLLTIAATAINKVYDGKSTATATLSTEDIVTNDKVTLNQTAANFINANQENDKNVGQNKTVRVTGLSLSGDDAANYLLINGEESADTTANLTAKSLTIAVKASDKVYNANTMADVALSTRDMVEGDVLTLNKTAANFDTKNVGMGKTVTVEGLSLGGTDAGNYAISNANAKATDTADISKAALSVSGITADNKTYDGGTNAMVSTANAKLNGLFEGDKLVVSATGLFADKKAEMGKTVTLKSIYTGDDVDNYTITDQANTAADIAKRSGVVVTADKQSKTVGSADPKLTFSVTGLLADDALNGSLTREVGEAAGLYDITQGTLGNENYVISQFNPAQLTISQPIADVAIANAQTLEPKLDLPSEREAMEERSGDVAPFFIAANQARASGPAQLVVVNGGIKLPAGQEEQQ